MSDSTKNDQPTETMVQYGGHRVLIKTGVVACQATASVWLEMGNTVVIAALVHGSKPTDVGFFPLTVSYQEKTYAWGSVPGGYFKREGRPSEEEILTSRMIDRAIRPMVPSGYDREVQITTTLVSFDPAVGAKVPAMLASFLVMALSDVPCHSLLGAARIGYINDTFVLNPSDAMQSESTLDLFVAASGGLNQSGQIVMVESSAQGVSEEIVINALEFAQHSIMLFLTTWEELGGMRSAKPRLDWSNSLLSAPLKQMLCTEQTSALQAILTITGHTERHQKLAILKDTLQQHYITLCNVTEGVFQTTFSAFYKQCARTWVVTQQTRLDGRQCDDLRPIDVALSVLPGAHGSCLFTRGEHRDARTQVLASVTLGTEPKSLETPYGKEEDVFLLHYNFPGYSVGELSHASSPKRREIGHGFLARKALQAVLPSQEEFPYVIRVVTDVLESNGSSSMGSVIAATCALLDAGVPLKAKVVGVAMGLMYHDEQLFLLHDITGDEDHVGDMDFKVAGTETGITALQMDVKIRGGLSLNMLSLALQAARKTRATLLSVLLPIDCKELSNRAPKIFIFNIPKENIREVIGKGGATIRGISEASGTRIDISDTGVVKVAAHHGGNVDHAVRAISKISAKIELGQIYEGCVARIVEFGAFITINGKDCLLHISQICHERLESVHERLQEGQMVRVKVLEIDPKGRIRLSMKAISDRDG
jgi:polyribonucleotide nucleotidyltransferase